MASPCDISRGSHKKTEWICDCGKTTFVAVCSVISGNTRSCRRCNLLTAEDMSTRKFGKLRMKSPSDILPGSREKVAWVCDCGKETSCQPLSVTTGHTTSCGRCDVPDASYYETAKFGSLRMETPEPLALGSHSKVSWLCDCGRKTKAAVGSVTSGHTSTCGRCRQSDSDFWAAMSYGRLTRTEDSPISKGSNKKTSWRCSCGVQTTQMTYDVTSGKVVSCGACILRAKDWHRENLDALRSLVCPVLPASFPGGLLVPLETISGVDVPFRASCGICGKDYHPRISNLRRGSSLTCGCTNNHVSGASSEIADFVRKLGVEVVQEHHVGGLDYDIFVPSSNLLIEFNGIRWHSMDGSRERDLRKYRNAVVLGYSYIMLFEDEWARSRPKVESLLRNRLFRAPSRPLRPSACEVRPVSHSESSPFYDLHHYIGPCLAKVHYGVFHENVMVACASFSVPSRQSFHPWELVRMASRPDYRVHGIWSKVLKRFWADYSPSSVVSFSEKRLFSGAVYGRIGFVKDGDVRPDYSWAKSGVRHHKSGLRKRGLERHSGLTESQLREAEGYRKIWDLGKVRWVWRPTPPGAL
jgi:hypothetical protein